MSLGQLWIAVRVRWFLVLGLIAVGAMIAVGISLLIPPTYTASAQLVILPSPTEILRLADYHSSTDSDGLDLKTQLDIMRSDRVLQRATERLNLSHDPKFLEAYRSAKTRASLEQFGVEALTKGMTIIPAKDSRVVTIDYESNDAVEAADRANAIVDSVLDINSEFVNSSAKQSAIDFNKRIDVTHLNNLSTELESARSELSQARSRYAARLAARTSDGDMTAAGVIDSPALQALRLEESKAVAELQATADRLGVQHPDYKEHINRLRAIRTQIDVEIRRIVAGLSVDVQAAEKRYEDVKLKFDSQRRDLLDESTGQRDASASDDAADPSAPVAAPGGAAPAAAQAAAKPPVKQPSAPIVDRRSDNANANAGMMILQRAEPPYQSQSGKIRANAVIGGIFGMVLGVVAAALWELGDLRIRGPEDVERWLDVPALAAIPVSNPRDIRSDIRSLAPPRNPRLTDNRPDQKDELDGAIGRSA